MGQVNSGGQKSINRKIPVWPRGEGRGPRAAGGGGQKFNTGKVPLLFLERCGGPVSGYANFGQKNANFDLYT